MSKIQNILKLILFYSFLISILLIININCTHYQTGGKKPDIQLEFEFAGVAFDLGIWEQEQIGTMRVPTGKPGDRRKSFYAKIKEKHIYSLVKLLGKIQSDENIEKFSPLNYLCGECPNFSIQYKGMKIQFEIEDDTKKEFVEALQLTDAIIRTNFSDKAREHNSLKALVELYNE